MMTNQKNKKLLKELDAPKDAKATMLRLLSHLKDQRARLILVIICVFFYTLFNIWTPIYSATVVDQLWKAIQQAWKAGTAFRITWENCGRGLTYLTIQWILTGVFYYLQSCLMASVAERLTLSLRTRISRKLNVLPLKFFDRNKAGELLSRVTSDLDKISETLQTGLLKFISAVGTIVGSLIIMFYYSVLLSLIFVAFTILSLLLTKLVARKNLECASARQETLGELTGIVEEFYTGRNVIKAYNHEADSIERSGQATEANRKVSTEADFYTNCMNPIVRLITRLGQVIIAIIAGRFMIEGRMSIGVVQAFFQYINQSAEPLTQASFMINNFQSALASAERTFEILDHEEEVPDTTSPVSLPRAKGDVCFRNVSFGYDPDRILMKEISFTARAGQKIAIVGSTGAARPEIVRAAKAAKIGHFIRTLPKGYDTILQSDGGSLSAGQKQLLTIARVFLCNPPILILDEATSSVDTRTEKEIGKAMSSLMENRTSFVIAHRLSTIRDADTILFMQNGNIIEQGSHEKLLRKKGVYAALYYSQF